jgi:hypothetical protein
MKFIDKFVLAVFVLVASFSFVVPADAQIMGAVLDGNWNPVQGAFVTISYQEDSGNLAWRQVGSSTTDEGGRYDLRRYDGVLLTDGTYLVVIQAFGAQVVRKEVEVRYGYAYLEDVFIVQDMPGLGIQIYTFDFEEGSYAFWVVTRNGQCLSSKYIADTIIDGPAETKEWNRFSRRASGCGFSYIFIPRGVVPEGSTFWGNVTILSSKSDMRVYSQDNWFNFTPGEQSPYLKKSADAPSLVMEALQEARAKVLGNK